MYFRSRLIVVDSSPYDTAVPWITMQRSCRRWRFVCRVPLRPLSGAVGQLESEGRESIFWSLTEWGVVTSSWWLSLRTLIFSSLVSSTYGETQGEANLCSLDQYPITFTYLVVLRVRQAHRTGPSRECECSIAASLQPGGMCVGFTLQISQTFHLI